MIFLTGLPRSGTKLLRDLLNGHSQISIPQVETVMIPYLVKKFGLDCDLNDQNEYQGLVTAVKQTPFFRRYQSRDLEFDFDGFRHSNSTISWSLFFEKLIAFYGPKPCNDNTIIGDKTPGYIDHTDLLLSIWPNARIIHIVRDPRDYVCSVRKVWSKNIFRAAGRWNDTMVRLNKKENLHNENLHTIYYEDLLDNPQAELGKVCEFLGIAFEENMLVLEASHEQYGEAKGQTKVVHSNKNKYKEILSPEQVRHVEELVYNGAKLHNYELTNSNINARDISKLEMKKYKLLDGIGALNFHVREKGLIEGTRYFLQLHRVNIKN